MRRDEMGLLNRRARARERKVRFEIKLDSVRVTPECARRQVAAPNFQYGLTAYFEKELIAFQMNGKVPHVWPRCCGRNPKRSIRPLPTETSASAIFPRRRSSPSNQPDRSTSRAA